MTTISHRALPVRRCVAGVMVALLAAVSAGGCATTTYRATELPPQFAAAPIDRLNRADLSRLTSYSVRSNQIGVGDLLSIEIFSGYGDSDLEPALVNVAPNGMADVPLIGQVKIEGMTPDEASEAICDAARKRDVFRTPHVSVEMKEQKTNKVYVSGAVMEPGIVELARGNSTLLAALLAAGDITEDASPDVTIRRPALAARTPDALRGNPLRTAGGPNAVQLATYEEGLGEQAETIEVDLVSASQKGDGGYYLDDGDVVHVKRRPERKIQFEGLVNTPGEVEMPPNEDLYLLSALALAGGTKLQFADSVVITRRPADGGEPITITASIREVRKNRGNIRIQENDVISVVETPVTVAFETLKTFFRFSVGSSVALF